MTLPRKTLPRKNEKLATGTKRIRRR